MGAIEGGISLNGKTMLFTNGGYINALSYQDKIRRPVTTHDVEVYVEVERME